MRSEFDIVVAGGGHAGCEAALAGARMGASILLVSLKLDRIAQMSCNPAVGGQAKGHLVRELDALGGEMGYATDHAGIQFRKLNTSKGPAVRSSRAQVDRIAYREFVQDVVARQPNLETLEDCVTEVVVRNGRIAGVRTEGGLEIGCRAAILTSGTFLNGLIHIGDTQRGAGRIGEKAAFGLTECLVQLGFDAGRLKTGTPPRLDGNTINFDSLEEQPGHDDFEPWSLRTRHSLNNSAKCWITYTTDNTHELIRDNLHASALYSGKIKAAGPRYCPSIEDKVVRFSEKPRHQLFLEPEGNGTDEIYPNGFSTSLAEDIQIRAIRTVPGLEEVEITVPGYAVEYDFFYPYQIKPTTETKIVEGLYFSGQINGTSGYEEAAVQGFMSGVNAVLKLRGEPEFVLDRSQAYIGVLLDDLATKSTEEPYRMFTSRAEYRLALREDNAVERLIDYGYRFGLVDEKIYASEKERIRLVHKEAERLETVTVPVSELPNAGTIKKRDRVTFANALRMAGTEISDMARLNDDLRQLPEKARKDVAIRVKYKGYLEKQEREIQKFRRLESYPIPETFDFSSLNGIKAEASEKLARHRPVSIGQASRISGISPGDISVLMIHLKKHVA